MDPKTDISFLEKPEINAKKLKYIENEREVYANLYEIILKKPLKLYQYPYKVAEGVESGDTRIRDKLFKACSRQLKEIYGECFISGDILYGINKVELPQDVKCCLFLKGKNEYTLEFQKYAKEKTINQSDIHTDPLSKQCIEMLIKDILHANPKLEFYKGLFVLTNKKQKIETDRVSISFYPGFATSFMETDSGNYLNVTIKNKIIQNDTVLDYLKNYKYNNNKDIQEKIRDDLIGRSFKVSYMKKNHRIDDILFDRNPENQTFSYNGKNTNLLDYYEAAHKLKIKDKTQPLLVVRRKGPQEQFTNLYFIPELCSLTGLEDEEAKDGFFMKELAKKTKLTPNDRVKKTNEFLDLLKDSEREKPKENKNKNNDSKSEIKEEKLSAKEKSELYGIEVKPVDKLFKAYYMEETKLLAGKKKSVTPRDRTFPVLEKKEMTSWLCFYEKMNYNNAENLFNTLKAASKGFNLHVEEPEWIEMPNNASAKDWTSTADEYIGKGKKDYSFAVFLVGKKDSIYKQLKIHSLCTNGYVSQVVKSKTLQNKKGLMSICSKILLQINAKLGGVSYKTEIEPQVQKRDIMVIGVDSSHIKGKGTGVAMVATINDTFTDFFNKEEIINEKNKEQLQYSVSSFIKEAVVAYNKRNKKKPKNIIIYRQGVSLQQKEFLKTEIKEITLECKNDDILFYYILVNTKTTFKFFEKSGNSYNNPESGLLVIDGVTNKKFFEFYIQPQEVTQGSATPSCFHVAYGNMNFPEIIPKFTYDLCHIYSNWQGTVRIPNVIKAAEKLSKMTAKYTYKELNKDVQYGQAYL